jgi:hypothetical protein
MSVREFRELARVNVQRIGEPPNYQRRFIATLNDPNTNANVIVAAIGCVFGAPHPEWPVLKCVDLELNEAYEGNRYWVEVVAQYRLPEATRSDLAFPDLLPWLRPDVWRFQTQGVAVPALYYYDGSTQKPLVNSANDYFEGLTVDEAQQKITIQANRQAFPSALAAAVTNTVNDSAYLGFAADCVKVQGISAEPASELINGQEVKYWKITSELLARQTGWNLLLPDVGFNYLDGGVKKRATVKGPDSEDLPSSNPIALDGNGALASGLPAILTRRVYRQVSMSQWFGTPPP